MSDQDFDPARYWKQRVAANSDIGEVGHRSLGRIYNEYLYRRRSDVLTAALVELNLDLKTATVLDIGVGSGYYVDFWHKLGVPVLLGIDLSSDSIDKLRRKYVNYRFKCADITDPSSSADIDLRFSVITVFDVLYHIVNDAAAQRALNSIAGLLKPQGYVLVFEHVMNKDYMLREHVKYRSAANYAKMLELADLEIVQRKPLFAFLEPPIVGRKPLDILISGGYWIVGYLMKRWPRLAHLIGRSVYNLDTRLDQRGFRTPNHSLLILRKRTK